MTTLFSGFVFSVFLLFTECRTNSAEFLNSSDVSVSTADSPFPLNTTTTPTTDMARLALNCSTEISCRRGCSSTPESDPYPDTRAHCHCDEACLLYQDCCADYVELCGKKPKEDTRPVTGGSQTFDCVKLSTDKTHAVGIFMITTCASDWTDDETRQKCLAGSEAKNQSWSSQNIKEQIPVEDLLYFRQYRNYYCALCNNVLPVVMMSWRLKIRCNIHPPIAFNSTQVLDFMLKYCPIREVQPRPGFNIRTCLPMVSACPVSEVTTEHHEGCLKGPSGIMNTNLTNYKNYHCLLCNGLPLNSSNCGPREPGLVFTPKSFEIVMDFDTTTHQENDVISQKTSTACATDHVYDPHLEICRKGFLATQTSAIRDKYRIKLWTAPIDEAGTHSLSRAEFRDAICGRFAFHQSQIDEINIASEDRFTSVVFNLYAGAFYETMSSATRKDGDPEPLDVKVLLNFNQSFEMTISETTWMIHRATQRQLACVKSDVFSPQEFRVLPTGFAQIINTKEEFSPKKFFLVRNEDSTNSLLVCKSKFTVWCSFVLLPVDPSEYKLFPNKTLLHNTTGVLYKPGDYDLEKDKAWICTNYTKVIDENSTAHYNFSDLNNTVVIQRNRTVKSKVVSAKTESIALRYITVLGLSISIVSLALTLLTHCVFQELRGPLPGKNLMSLCLALLLFQFTWLLGSGDTDKPVFCSIIAASLHVFILAAFSCTAVIAFDTRRTFSSKISKAPGRSLRQGMNLRFVAYSGLAWGAPLLFVVGCVFLDRYDVVFIGYGNEDACWLVNVNAKIVVFATPVASILLYNVAAFAHTVWVISKARKQGARAKASRQDQQAVFKIYVRLVTLMGFSWFFSFSAELIHEALLYPFVLFTTTQGVYIFAAFVCKARVLKLFKDMVGKSRTGLKMSIQKTGSTELRSSSPYKMERETQM